MSAPQRSKEDAMDYRYFPEPDLTPLILSDEYIAARAVTDRPIERRVRYLDEYGLLSDDARILSRDRETSDYFERLVALTGDPKKSCSYITTVLFSLMEASQTHRSMAENPVSAEALARVIDLVNRDEISSTNSKVVVERLFTG